MTDQKETDHPPAPQGEMLLFQSVDGRVRLECRFGADTLWLSQAMICELYGKAKATISEHISHILAEGELIEDSVVRFYRTTAADNKPYNGLKEIQSKEERYAAGPHDPVLMNQAIQGLRKNQWFEELALDDGKRYEYRPLAQSGTHRPAYEALWSAEQRHQINELIELMRSWDTAKCERVATLYSAWNDLLIEGREAHEAAILQEVLHGWNESKLKYSEAQWRAELGEMHQHSFLTPTGFGKRTSGGKLTLLGFEPSI